VQPCPLDIADEPAPLAGGDTVAGGRLRELQGVAREDEEGTAHRQVLDQRPVDVQRTLRSPTVIPSRRARADR
jgi:hypothetical protein